jgi:hypothetical protein
MWGLSDLQDDGFFVAMSDGHRRCGRGGLRSAHANDPRVDSRGSEMGMTG